MKGSRSQVLLPTLRLNIKFTITLANLDVLYVGVPETIGQPIANRCNKCGQQGHWATTYSWCDESGHELAKYTKETPTISMVGAELALVTR